jgi:hypothetical protein
MGFWLGGITCGTVGCIIGLCMPYRHPVAITISAIWWGLYVGGLSAGVGAVLGLLLGGDPSSGRTEAPCDPPTEEPGYEIDVMPTKDSKTAKDMYLLMRKNDQK